MGKPSNGLFFFLGPGITMTNIQVDFETSARQQFNLHPWRTFPPHCGLGAKAAAFWPWDSDSSPRSPALAGSEREKEVQSSPVDDLGMRGSTTVDALPPSGCSAATSVRSGSRLATILCRALSKTDLMTMESS